MILSQQLKQIGNRLKKSENVNFCSLYNFNINALHLPIVKKSKASQFSCAIEKLRLQNTFFLLNVTIIFKFSPVVCITE